MIPGLAKLFIVGYVSYHHWSIVVKLPKATNSAAVLDVNDMASTCADALQQMVADTLPRCPKNPPCKGFSELPQSQDRHQEAWNIRVQVQEKLRVNLKGTGLNKELQATDEAFKLVGDAE